MPAAFEEMSFTTSAVAQNKDDQIPKDISGLIGDAGFDDVASSTSDNIVGCNDEASFRSDNISKCEPEYIKHDIKVPDYLAPFANNIITPKRPYRSHLINNSG
jgi:hypothetical protein